MKIKIVILDDDSSLLNLYKRNFEIHNFDCKVFNKGPTCLEYCLCQKNEFDIMICDLNLNDSINGYQVALAISLVKPNIPIIALSGYLFEYTKYQDFDKIFCKALQKPIYLIDINRIINEILNDKSIIPTA